jgi:hypothetical protein
MQGVYVSLSSASTVDVQRVSFFNYVQFFGIWSDQYQNADAGTSLVPEKMYPVRYRTVPIQD